MGALLLVLLPILAWAAEPNYYIETGIAVNKDINVACAQAVTDAREKALRKATSYVERKIYVWTSSNSQGSGYAKLEKLSSSINAAIKQEKQVQVERGITSDGLPRCVMKVEFEFDSTDIEARAEIEHARKIKTASIDMRRAAINETLTKNAASYKVLKESAQSSALGSKNQMVRVTCPQNEITMCDRQVDEELARLLKNELAEKLRVDVGLIMLKIHKQLTRSSTTALNETQQSMIWEGSVKTTLSIADPFHEENEQLRKELQAMASEDDPIRQLSVLNQVTPVQTTYEQVIPGWVFPQAISMLFSYDCANCGKPDEGFAGVAQANVGSNGLIIKASYREWIGISLGLYQDSITYCSRSELRQQKEVCTADDTASAMAVGFGSYLAWRYVSFEAMRMSYTSEPEVFGAPLSEAYWRYDLSLRSYSNEDKTSKGRFVAELSYSLRKMPEYNFINWDKQSGLSVKIGYQF